MHKQNRFSFGIVEPEEALAHWRISPHASVFTHPDVLSRLATSVEWWMAWKGSEPACLWPIALDGAGHVALPAFSYYVGPIWSPVYADLPPHRALTTRLDVYDGFVARLIERYGAIHAHLGLGMDDVRPFDWWNYHEPNGPRFTIAPRYTATIRGLRGTTDADLRKGFRGVRRRECDRAERTGEFEPAEATVAELQKLLMAVMGTSPASQGHELSAAVAALMEIVELGHGRLLSFRACNSGELASAALLLYGNQVANLVLYLTRPERRHTGLPAWTVLQALRTSREDGADVFDFNGANSPQRGDDKHSYGADARLYFELRWPESRRL